MEYDFDIVVIGSGAGGGTLASACAAAGKSVLVIERGSVAGPSEMPHDERRTLIEKVPYDDRVIQLDDRASKLYMGGVVGGGSAVYGGALVRPKPEDFEPGRYYGSRIPRAIHNWPIEFQELADFFPAAEQLYHVNHVDNVHLSHDEVRRLSESTEANRAADSKHSDHSNALVTDAVITGTTMTRVVEDAQVNLEQKPLPLAAINQKLIGAAWKSGLNPYRLPLAIDSSRCLRCDHCAGFICPTGARRSSAQLIQGSLQRGESLKLITNCEVLRLKRGGRSQIEGIDVHHRDTNVVSTFRARRYVLAAGAIGSAAILLRSGFSHPLTGRNFMMHYSPISVGLFLNRTEADRTFVKQVGLSDFYFGTHELPEKMGIVQSLPAPGPLMMAKAGLNRLPKWLLNSLRSRMLPLVGIIEDLPNLENCVSITNGSGISLHHKYDDFDIARGKALEKSMAALLKKTGAMRCVGGKIPSKEHVAHQCGTLRFGSDRESAVLDRDCRLFDQPDVFVADGSFMPTSLGVGPSLTIISNALRVAQTVAAEC